jgi:hypothetical protein
MSDSQSAFSDLIGAGDKSTCEVCGNHYDKCIHIRKDGETHVFDSFECAIHALAPRCGHCGCMIIGHGMETEGQFYCCAHCASASGVTGFEDRLENQHERKGTK